MLHTIMTGLLLSTALAQTGLAASGRELFKVRLRIPGGASTISFVISPAQKITPFQVLYTPSNTCRQIALNPFVQYLGNSGWNASSYNGSVFNTADQSVSGLRFNLQSPTNYEQVCDMSVLTFAAPPSAPAPAPSPQPNPPPSPEPGDETPSGGEWREAGTLNYPGGVFSLIGIDLNAAYLARDILVRIPDSCVGVSLTELGVIRLGAYVKAQASTERPGVFQLDKLSSFYQVRVSLSGPTNQACPISIYVYDQSRSQVEDAD